MGFTINGRDVINDQLWLEIQPLSDGLPGQQSINFGDSRSTALDGTGKYQCGELKVHSQNCRNAGGATGRGFATIKPTQCSASDGPRNFLLDGDRAICQGQLYGSSWQKPGPCRCAVIVRAAAKSCSPPTSNKTQPAFCEPVEIVALAFAPQERALLGFTRAELEDIVQECEKLERTVDLAHWSDEQGNAGLKKSAVEQLERMVLNPDKTKGSDVSELIWSKGRKSTFVRSKKIRNHWRKYALNDRAEKHGKLRDLKKLDKLKKKIKAKFTKKEGRTKPLWALPEENQELFNAFRYQLEFLRGDNYQVGGEIALFRLVMNGSAGSSTFDFKEKKLKLAAEGSLTGSLIDGSIQGELFLPNVAGWHWNYNFDGEDYDFGILRCKFRAKASGYAGVSLVLSGQLGLDTKSPELTVGMSGDAFAGISGSIESELNLQWKQPGADQKFQTLATAVAEANVAAGVGGSAEVTFEFSGRKLMIRVKAKLVVGLGGGGCIYFAVEPPQLVSFLNCVGLNLWRLNFHYMEVLTPEAFEYVSSLWAYAMAFGHEIDEDLQKKSDKVLKWWRDEHQGQVDGESLALRILANPTAYIMAVPEAKGRILCMLTRTFWFSREELQEEAALVFLKQNVRTRRELEKICQCMTLQGGQRIPATEGRRMLDDLFDLQDQLEFNRWVDTLPENVEPL